MDYVIRADYDLSDEIGSRAKLRKFCDEDHWFDTDSAQEAAHEFFLKTRPLVDGMAFGDSVMFSVADASGHHERDLFTLHMFKHLGGLRYGLPGGKAPKLKLPGNLYTITHITRSPGADENSVGTHPVIADTARDVDEIIKKHFEKGKECPARIADLDLRGERLLSYEISDCTGATVLGSAIDYDESGAVRRVTRPRLFDRASSPSP